jgi:hypothetical protein
LPPPALGSGAQIVALLPSTAASAYIPDSSELAVADLQRAMLSVGVRSGRRVGIVTDPPTLCVPSGVSRVKALPSRRVTLVLVGPMATSKVLPCQCSPFSVTRGPFARKPSPPSWLQHHRQAGGAVPDARRAAGRRQDRLCLLGSQLEHGGRARGPLQQLRDQIAHFF